jgi:cytochrome c5
MTTTANKSNRPTTTADMMASSLDFARRCLLASASSIGNATTLHQSLRDNKTLSAAALSLASSSIAVLERRPNRAVQTNAAALLFDVCAALPLDQSPLIGRTEWLARLATGNDVLLYSTVVLNEQCMDVQDLNVVFMCRALN